MNVYLIHIDEMLIGLVFLGEVEIAIYMAGEVNNIENQVLRVMVRAMVFNGTFNNISVISWLFYW
jgi:hypothetical protein